MRKAKDCRVRKSLSHHLPCDGKTETANTVRRPMRAAFPFCKPERFRAVKLSR